MKEKLPNDASTVLPQLSQKSEVTKKKSNPLRFLTHKNSLIIFAAILFAAGMIINDSGYKLKLPSFSWPTRKVAEVSTTPNENPNLDPNVNGFASPYYETLNYNPGEAIDIYYNIAGSDNYYRGFVMRQTAGEYYLTPIDSNQNYKINTNNFSALVSFLVDENSKDKGSQTFYITEFVENEVNKVSVISKSRDGAFGRIYTYQAFDFDEFGNYASIDFIESGDKAGNFISLTTRPDQNINKQCDTYAELTYKGVELQNKTICYYSTFVSEGTPYFIDNPEGVLSLLSLDKTTFEVKTTKMPQELVGEKLYVNNINGYNSKKTDKPIVAIAASLYEKELEIKKVILDKAKFELSVEPVSKADFPNFKNAQTLNNGAIFSSETENKYFEIEVKGNNLLINTKDADADYDVKVVNEYFYPVNPFQKVLTEYEKLKFVSPLNMSFESLNVPSGVGGGGGPEENPFITIRVNKSEDLITFYLFGYISATEDANYVSKTLVRQIDYKLSTNALVSDSGYKYFDSLHTSAYSGNYIYQFNDDTNNFIFASGGGDGCGGGSSYSNLNLNTNQTNVKLDVLLIASMGCESIDNYKEMYASFNAKNFGDKIATHENLIYFSSKERGLTDRNHYTQSWDNVTVLDLNTGTTKLIKQFASEPKYIDEVTYEYLEQIKSPDAENHDLKDVYMVVHNTESEIVDIYKLDPVKSTVEQVEDDFKLEGFY